MVSRLSHARPRTRPSQPSPQNSLIPCPGSRSPLRGGSDDIQPRIGSSLRHETRRTARLARSQTKPCHSSPTPTHQQTSKGLRGGTKSKSRGIDPFVQSRSWCSLSRARRSCRRRPGQPFASGSRALGVRRSTRTRGCGLPLGGGLVRELGRSR